MLREIALPRLWAIVQIHSLRELGQLRAILRASPEIAQHIRSFVFHWVPDEDPDGEGSALELAFSAEDGVGFAGQCEPPMIQSAHDFNDCITEIVCKLTGLEAFGWYSTFEAFEALESLNTLSSLGYGLMRPDPACLHDRKHSSVLTYLA